jgi:hypothetical protein
MAWNDVAEIHLLVSIQNKLEKIAGAPCTCTLLLCLHPLPPHTHVVLWILLIGARVHLWAVIFVWGAVGGAGVVGRYSCWVL